MLEVINNPPTDNLELRFMRYLALHQKMSTESGVSVYVDLSQVLSDYGITKSTIEGVIELLEKSSCLIFAYWLPENSEPKTVFVSVNGTFETMYAAYNHLASKESAKQIASSHLDSHESVEESFLVSFDIQGHSTPVIIVDGKSYKVLGTYSSQVSDIISTAIRHQPNKTIDKKTLKDLLKKDSKIIGSLPNIKEKIRKSIYGAKGILSPFVDSGPDYLKVKTSSCLSDDQLKILLEHCEQI